MHPTTIGPISFRKASTIISCVSRKYLPNQIENKSTKNKYPVFSKYNPKIYFNKDYAEQLIESYPEYNLKLS